MTSDTFIRHEGDKTSRNFKIKFHGNFSVLLWYCENFLFCLHLSHQIVLGLVIFVNAFIFGLVWKLTFKTLKCKVLDIEMGIQYSKIQIYMYLYYKICKIKLWIIYSHVTIANQNIYSLDSKLLTTELRHKLEMICWTYLQQTRKYHFRKNKLVKITSHEHYVQRVVIKIVFVDVKIDNFFSFLEIWWH